MSRNDFLIEDEGSGSGYYQYAKDNITRTTTPVMSLNNIFDTTNQTAFRVNEGQESFRYLGVTIGLFAIFLGTFGNSMTIIAFCKNRKLRRNVFNLFIVNLSLVDLLTASCMLPFNVAGYIYMEWPFGNDHVTCSIQAFFYFCCGYTSVVCLLAITMNRFVGIVFPDRYVTLYSSKWSSVILLSSWLIAPAFLLPFLVAAIINNSNGIPRTPIGWKEREFLCTFINIDGWGPYMQVVRVVFQFLPLVIMIVAYIFIWKRVHQSNIRLRENAGCREYRERIESARYGELTVLNKGCDSPVLAKHRSSTDQQLIHMIQKKDSMKQTENNNHRMDFEMEYPETEHTEKKTRLKKLLKICRNKEDDYANKCVNSAARNKSFLSNRSCSVGEQQRFNKEQRMIYVSVIIWITFTVLFLPSLVVNLLPSRKSLSPLFHMAASNVSWFNSCVNPLVYVALHRRMRNEYKKIIKRCVISLFSLDHH
ncbi:G-protein coupled receptor 84-like [Styela clava]